MQGNDRGNHSSFNATFGGVGQADDQGQRPTAEKRMDQWRRRDVHCTIDYMKQQHSTGKPFFVDAMILNVRSFGFGIDLEANAYLPRRGMWPGAESNCRHEISSPHTHRDYVVTIGRYWYLFKRLTPVRCTFILPIRT